MPNIELLNKVLTRIESDPEHWRQDQWAQRTECGTAYCFAGWACVLSGHEVDWVAGATTLADGTIQTALVTTGELIDELAVDLLGLDVRQARELFYIAESLEDVRLVVKEIIAESES